MTDVLIERASFLASLEGLLGEAAKGSGRLVFLGGEAGVGKTTLAMALAESTEEDRDQLLHDLLVQVYPTKRTQDC